MYLSAGNRPVRGIGQAPSGEKNPAGPSPWSRAVPYVGVSTALFLGQSLVPKDETWQKILKTTLLAGGALAAGLGIAKGMNIMVSEGELATPSVTVEGLTISGNYARAFFGVARFDLTLTNNRAIPVDLLIDGEQYYSPTGELEKKWEQVRMPLKAGEKKTHKFDLTIPWVIIAPERRMVVFTVSDAVSGKVVKKFEATFTPG